MAFFREQSLMALLAFFLIFAPCCYSNWILGLDGSLNANEALTNGTWTFVMQEDCNLALYGNDTLEWSSNTAGQGFACHADLQRDGNFVVYSGPGRTTAVWATRTFGPPVDYNLYLFEDGVVILMESNVVEPLSTYVIYPKSWKCCS